MVRINENINNIKFDVNLHHRISVLSGDSASGKTFLLNIIRSQYLIHSTNYTMLSFEASDYDENSIVSICSNREYVLLDNADLYMSPRLYSKLIEVCGNMVVSIHSHILIPCSKDKGVYTVYYDGKVLRTEETGFHL